MFQGNSKRSLRDLDACGGAPHDCLQCFTQEAEDVPLPPPKKQRQWETDNKARTAFVPLPEEKFDDSLNFSQDLVYSEKCSFSLHGAVNK